MSLLDYAQVKYPHLGNVYLIVPRDIVQWYSLYICPCIIILISFIFQGLWWNSSMVSFVFPIFHWLLISTRGSPGNPNHSFDVLYIVLISQLVCWVVRATRHPGSPVAQTSLRRCDKNPATIVNYASSPQSPTFLWLPWKFYQRYPLHIARGEWWVTFCISKAIFPSWSTRR